MKAHRKWSYKPYKPFFYDTGDIYITRIVPGEDNIEFYWLGNGESCFKIYYRIKDEGKFIHAGDTKECSYKIVCLSQYCDYEFFVESGDKKSRNRFARCGDAVGTVVNYLHPDDRAYSFSGNFLASPSIIRHPDGYLLASMDVFGHGTPQNLTLIYRSDDDGKTWQYQCELFPCFWGKLFVYEGDVYMMSVSTEYGDLLIGKSVDGGKTFSEPVILLRGSNGKNGEPGVHKTPMPVVEYDGRIWGTLEWGAWARGYHAVMVMSAPLGSDLLEPDNWTFSQPVKYDPSWEGTGTGNSCGNIEGSLVVVEDRLYDIMRFEMGVKLEKYGLILAYEIDTKNPEKPVQFSHSIKFPANNSKFEIQYDKRTQKYYSIASLITDENYTGARNVLALMVSDDCINWEILKTIYDKSDCNLEKIGFQYVSFIIEQDEIIFLCRTGMNNAAGYHDTNYSTFDRIKI